MPREQLKFYSCETPLQVGDVAREVAFLPPPVSTPLMQKVARVGEAIPPAPYPFRTFIVVAEDEYGRPIAEDIRQDATWTQELDETAIAVFSGVPAEDCPALLEEAKRNGCVMLPKGAQIVVFGKGSSLARKAMFGEGPVLKYCNEDSPDIERWETDGVINAAGPYAAWFSDLNTIEGTRKSWDAFQQLLEMDPAALIHPELNKPAPASEVKALLTKMRIDSERFDLRAQEGPPPTVYLRGEPPKELQGKLSTLGWDLFWAPL